MRKIRLGNDFILKLVLYKVDDKLVLNNEGDPISGTPEDLTLSSNLILKIYNIKYRKEYKLNTSLDINIISSEILQNIQQTGQHYIVLEYDLANPDFLNGLQHFKVGLYAFEILSAISDAELVDQIIIGSCVSSGGDAGKSAYEIAVENGFIGTEQEWLDSLSPNTDNFATKIELALKANLTDIPSLVGYATETYVSNSIINKVDKINGKGLSTNDYTTEEKDKLFGIAAGSEVNINPDWNAVSGKSQILNKPTTVSGYNISDVYTQTQVNTLLSGKEPVINAGTSLQYLRGDKTWQTLDKLSIGLNNVENTALSTWIGSGNLTTLGTITSGIWNGSSIPVNKGGTGLTIIGSPNQILKVNSTGTALEYATTSESSSGTVTSIDISVPLGLSVSGNPITTFGTIGIALTDGYSIPTTTKQTNWDTAYGWGNHSGLYKLISYVPLWSDISNKPTSLTGYGITDAQPFDDDLTAIASLSGNSGLLKKTAVDTWSLDTNTYLTSITKQQVEDVLIGSITSHTHNYQASNNNLNVISGLSGTGLLKKTGIDTWEFDSSSYLTSNQTITLSGDVSGSGTTNINIALNTVPVTKGGTGLTSFGSSLQVLRTNSDATGLEWATDAAGLTFLGQQYGVVFADTSVSISSTSPGTSGYLLKSNQTSAPSWIDPSTLTVGSAVKFYSDTITGTGSYFIPFLDNAENGYTDCKKSSNFYYSPSTQKLTAGYYAGTWNGTAISTSYGGTGLTSIGAAGQILKVNTGATGLEWGTISTGLTLSGTQYGIVYAATSNTIASTTAGIAGQFLQSNGVSAPSWVTSRDKGINSVTTLASLPVNKRLVVATLSAATTLSLASGLEVGDELHIFANNATESPFVQTLPNTGSFTSLSGTSITIPAYGVVEINLLCIQTNNYFLRAL